MTKLDTHIIPVLENNYAFIVTNGKGGAVIDPGEAGPVIAKLEELGVRPDFIINTHHHGDHIKGNTEIHAKYGSEIIAPRITAEKYNHIHHKILNSKNF